MSASVLWVLVANASRAQIYQTTHLGGELKLLEQFSHEKSRGRVLDLVTDRPGYGRPGSQLEPFVPRTDPKEVEKEKFAREIAHYLNTARSQNKFGKIIISASPHFLGDINQFTDNQTKKLYMHQIDHDYTAMNTDELKIF